LRRVRGFAASFYDVVLWVHITAVVTAFGALFAYPIFLMVNARAPITQRSTFHHAQIAFSKRVTGPVIGVILLAGVYLATDADLWSEVWVTVPFVLLFVIAGLGATVLRRGEERLVATSEAGDEAGYATALATLRRWLFVTLALIVVAIFFMSVKPFA
jgi:Sec-independent protein secretion pathway component TatC